MRFRGHAREVYKHFCTITTRWVDNDQYHHLNNVVYMSFFDTAVNEFLINQAKFSPLTSPALGVVVESSCQYFASLQYPDIVEVGLFVSKMSNSSIKYECGVFKQSSPICAAHGTFTHVYVDPKTRKSVAIPDEIRNVVMRRLLLTTIAR